MLMSATGSWQRSSPAVTVRVVNWLSFKIIENKFYCFTPSRAGDTLLWTLTTNHSAPGIVKGSPNWSLYCWFYLDKFSNDFKSQKKSSSSSKTSRCNGKVNLSPVLLRGWILTTLILMMKIWVKIYPFWVSSEIPLLSLDPSLVVQMTSTCLSNCIVWSRDSV